MSAPKLFLLDAFALIYRAYFAFANNPRVNSKGLNTSAVFGFTNTLMEVLDKEKPDFIGVAFDTAAPTSRHEAFADYKANRDAMPEDLALSIPYIKRLLEAMKIPIVELDGYEADDLIGTLAHKAAARGWETYMMTPDKDYGQLVRDNIHIYKPARLGNGAEKIGVKEICEKYNIKHPDQVIDILGLMGDKVDNIPGVPGVGEKTAIQLITDYSSIENLLQNTDKLKGKLKEKIEQNADQALFSKMLATIICDAPVEIEEELLKLKEPDADLLQNLFQELEFRRLADKILGKETNSAAQKPETKKPAENTAQYDLFSVSADENTDQPLNVNPEFLKTIKEVDHEYLLVSNEKQMDDLVKVLSENTEFCFDTETTSLNIFQAQLLGFSISVKAHHAWYIPVDGQGLEKEKVLNALKPFLQSENTLKIGQNIKYDLLMLKKEGIDLKGPLFDTMLAHYVLQPDMRHNMDVLSESYLGYSPVSITTLIGAKGKGQLSMKNVELEKIVEYAAEDADVTLQLKQVFEPMLQETSALSLVNAVEMPLVPVLADMEFTGVKIDTEVLKAISAELQIDIIQTEEQIFETCGLKFNIASPKQLGDVLFEHLKIDEKAKKTKTGQYATGEDVLQKLAAKNPVVEMILTYRELQKLKSTYVDSLPLLVEPATGKVHTSYNQAVAATGRLSSQNPNLQNIPIRTERGREIRKAFIPSSSDYLLLSADYSQIELRIIAALSGEENMIEDFKNGLDIHISTASKVYGIGLEEVTKDMRRNAKMVNFGIIYGISAFGLSERLGIPRKEAASIIESYFAQYPAIKSYMDSSIEFAREKGYVETILGRRRYLKDIHSRNAVIRGFAERNAINAPIQGSAADLIKKAMIEIYETFGKENLSSKMILQVHDELVFDVYNPEMEQVKQIVKQKMEGAIQLSVPLLVEMGAGQNWLEAH
jgi:DNA polymerase I